MSEFTAQDEVHMRRAIEESVLAVKNGCMPFGAIVTLDGKEVLSAKNASSRKGARGGSGDVTRHAEVELVRKICLPVEEGGLSAEDRKRAVLWASTEPCVMCCGAIYWSGVSNVVYGCTDLQLETISGPGGIDLPMRDIYARAARPMTVRGPFLDEEALEAHRASGVWIGGGGSAVDDIALERSLRDTGIGAAASAENGTVPVIDMSLPDQVVSEELWKAASEVGFFSLINHGIPKQVIDAAFAASAEFFSQDLESKMEQSPFEKRLNSGYEFMSQVRPSTGTPDQKESIQITARQGCMEERWPTFPPSFQSDAENLTEAAYSLSKRVVTMLEEKACKHLKPGTLSASHNLWGEDGQCTLRMLHYPPMDVETLRNLTNPSGGDGVHWRAGPHTDWDCVTLLFQREGQAGLECRANPRKTTGDAKWIPVPPVKGGIAVNIGDMLARWSDGALFSNLHRVRMPNEDECNSSRYSIAFFAQGDKSALIESPESEPITAGDYILSRVKSNFAK